MRRAFRQLMLIPIGSPLHLLLIAFLVVAFFFLPEVRIHDWIRNASPLSCDPTIFLDPNFSDWIPDKSFFPCGWRIYENQSYLPILLLRWGLFPLRINYLSEVDKWHKALPKYPMS